MKAMLETLDEVNWADVTACYVPGEQIPIFIRQLVSIDEAVQREAVQELFDNLEHQGDVYPATLFAVPFLIELLDFDAVHVKAEILDILRHVGSSVTADVDLATSVTHAVNDGLAVYQLFLSHPNDSVRKDATELFIGAAWDRDIHLLASELSKRLNLENDPENRIYMVRSLGAAIGTGQLSTEEVSTYRETLDRLMNVEGDLYVLTQKDLGQMQLPEGKIDLKVFERFLKRVEQLEYFDHPLLGNVLVATSHVLGNIDNPEASLLFVELMETIQSQVNISSISKELIDKAFSIGEKPNLNNLASHQTLAIKTILSKIVYWNAIEGYLAHYGLPTNRQTLAASVNKEDWPF
jgi:hypothetical protein